MASSGERRFSRHEAALILKRATDGEIRAHSSHDGLTLDELIAAAREAGIDPAAIQRAATLIPARPDPVQNILLGAPVRPVVRARVPGHLAAERAGEVRAALEQAIERTGELETEGCGLIWREEHGFGRTEVRAVPDGPVVEVSATAERGGHLLALVLVLATAVALALQPLGGFGGLAALGGPLLAVVGPVAAVMAGTRLLWPALQRPTLRRLEAATLEVGAMVEESGRAATE